MHVETEHGGTQVVAVKHYAGELLLTEKDIHDLLYAVEFLEHAVITLINPWEGQERAKEGEGNLLFCDASKAKEVIREYFIKESYFPPAYIEQIFTPIQNLLNL